MTTLASHLSSGLVWALGVTWEKEEWLARFWGLARIYRPSVYLAAIQSADEV